MFACFLILSAAVGLSFAAEDEALKEEWKAFKLEYGRKYNSEAEDEERFKIFADSTTFIREHNEKFAKGLVSYELGMNDFGDMSQEEWMFSLKCVDDDIVEVEGLPTYQPTKIFDMKKLPDEVDWRKHGYVTNVKNQKNCGSCWAFSATGALEGQQFKKTGKLISLSEQNLVDCSKNFGNKGCGGGTALKAFRYVMANGGIDTEDSYPYEAQDKTCRFKKENVGATVKDVLKLPDSEMELQAAVATFGPISVGIDANSTEFKYYKGGVFDHPACSRKANHAVLVVGYGIQGGNKYWMIKNSWDPEKWGMKGFALMARDKDNQCGIASYATLPVV